MGVIYLVVVMMVVMAAMHIAFHRVRDPLHPMMILGPMLIYIYVVQPAVLMCQGAFAPYLNSGQIDFASGLFAAGVSLLCLGVLSSTRHVPGRVRLSVGPAMEQRLVTLGGILGVVSVTAYWYAVIRSGGLLAVYSHAKAHYSSGSGWINELVNLSIPATALVILAWRGQKQKSHLLFLAILWASPLLIHGILGARRGPTFIICATLLVSWYISSKSSVSLWKVVSRFGVIGALMLFLVSHRDQIYLGSNPNLSLDKVMDRIMPAETDKSNDTVFMYGLANAVDETGTHYWGKRFAAIYLVRPIPRQLWPNKYRDVGLGWMVDQDRIAGIPDADWIGSVGWVPVKGSAPGFVADLYQEFSWAGLIGCYLIGWSFGWVWSNATRYSGVWVLLYIELLSLSVYVPTQSVSAIGHRFLLMAVPTLIVWHLYIGKAEAPRSRGSRRAKTATVVEARVEEGRERQLRSRGEIV